MEHRAPGAAESLRCGDRVARAVSMGLEVTLLMVLVAEIEAQAPSDDCGRPWASPSALVLLPTPSLKNAILQGSQ